MRKLNKDEYLRGVPDAKLAAMVNDLSPEGLCSVLCLSPRLQAKLRELIVHEYSIGTIQAAHVIEAWEIDDE